MSTTHNHHNFAYVFSPTLFRVRVQQRWYSSSSTQYLYVRYVVRYWSNIRQETKGTPTFTANYVPQVLMVFNRSKKKIGSILKLVYYPYDIVTLGSSSSSSSSSSIR